MESGTAGSAQSGTAHEGASAPAESSRPGANPQAVETGRDAAPCEGYTRPKYYAWADLLRRTFAIDVLACPDCGGRLRLLSTITDPEVIRKILHHVHLPVDLPHPAPARAPGWLPGLLPRFADAHDPWALN